MKKYLTVVIFLVLTVALISPVSVSAKTKAGTKSGSFFYFFDKAFERADLFFTFNPEKKAKKALENAEERLAEAEESANENKPEAVAEAMENYQENISLAETEAKAIKDEIKTKTFLSTIASSTSKNQEVLEKVLAKVPAEAKEAIEKAIEASKKRQEEAMKEAKEPEKEVSEIKQEIEGTKNELKEEEVEKINDKKEEVNKKEIEKLGQNKKSQPSKINQSLEIERLQKEIEDLKKQQLSSVPAQIPTTLTTPTNATVKQNDVNLRDSVVSLYAEQAEKIKLFIESTEMTDYITELKYRRDKLVRRVNFIKNNMYFTDINETTNAFNQVIDAYIQEHEKEIKYINENLAYINYQIALLEGYRTEYNKKISSLLANTKKFVTVEEYISANQHEIDVGLDEVYDPQSNIYTALRNYYKTVQKQEDVYASGATGIENILLKMGESTRVSTSYYQPMPQTAPPVIEFPKTTRCTVRSSGIVGELEVTCNETSF